jgi:hypothetical protein
MFQFTGIFTIFMLSLFDNLSIYSFPIWHHILLLKKGHTCHFGSHLILLLDQMDGSAI